MTTPLDTVYTADEAAERLRLTKRAVMKLGRELGACSKIGRAFLFSEEDLLTIWKSTRAEPTRELPRHPVVPSRARGSAYDRLLDVATWESHSPPTSVDRRVLHVLAWLSKQSLPKSHSQVDRAGKPTIEDLLRRGMVRETGRDPEGNKLVVITETGREEIRIAEKWAGRRKKIGKPSEW